MANPFQDALTESIDYLVKNRINKLDRDKTITATIVACNNALTQSYKVNYNNGYITAYAAEGASYRPNQMVYVLVPEGDFTKKLMILGPASMTAGDENITFVSSILNDYNTIGDNTLIDDNNIYPLGLHSYLTEDYQLIYDRDLIDDPDVKMLSIEIDKLNNYMRDAEAVLIEATFQTRLPKEHRVAKQGTYGIQFVLAFKDQSVEYNPDDPATVKHVSYVLDTNNMTGNPLLYNGQTEQYSIFPIDAENFLYIESILAFSNGFVSVSDPNRANLWGADILIRDLEFYGLRQVQATNGDYALRLSTPRGATFKTISADETLEVYGKVTYQINNEISDSTSYYWFQKDDRITSTSAEFHMYGGAGWRWLKDKGNNKHLVTSGAENRAYENKYMCVAVYKENLILKDYFTLYNEACKRDIEIISDLGLKFSFDRGTPNLTCLINGKDHDFDDTELRPDDYYIFAWSKINHDGSISSFTQSKEELEAELDQLMKDETIANKYSAMVNLKNKIYEVEGVTFNRNHLTYPVKNIDNSATFSCSVYMKDREDGDFFFAGNATITLLNETAANPNDYHIVITNGEQVFQYSESGVSPASDRYADPLEVKPLSCKFYDPAGLEVDPKTYTVTWVVPLENSLIIKPEEGLVINPANGLEEYYPYPDYPLQIADSFDYQALINQVNCLVDYNGQQYSRYSDLTFVKVGDNGTNGTDFVAKIDEVNNLNNEPLTIYCNDAGDAIFNDGLAIGKDEFGDVALEFELYNRNTLVTDISAVNWSMAGSSSYAKNIDVSDGKIKWNIDKQVSAKSKTNLIVKAETTYQSQKYYAFYPLPVVNYLAADVKKLVEAEKIHFDDQRLIKQVLYNADGHNPLYNKNQGVAFTIAGADLSNDYTYQVTLTAMGGIDDDPITAPFTLTPNREEDAGEKTVTIQPSNGYCFCYVDADLVYDGAFSNNRVHGEIFKNEESYCEFDVPIHFTLNRYGLASLNAWDGNHIEINDDDNYILAPQIGAGIKEPGNGFTGVVMGTASTYDQTQYRQDVPVGLLGYSNGEQSIALDARTGSAIFGLTEQLGDISNRYSEGRIELIPGGTSKIGNWSIGSRFLYNTIIPDDSPSPEKFVEKGPVSDRGMSVKDAKVFIPQHGSGVLLSADPPYLSVKGKDLTNSDINIEDANNQLEIGDSIEVEIDPSKLSVFTVFRHYEDEENKWTRTPMVGISRTGEFYTNSLQYASTAFNLGFVGAFGKEAGDKVYIGSRLGYDDSFNITSLNNNSSIIKFFVDYQNDNGTLPLHISGSTNRNNEYQRPIHLHGDEVVLYGRGVNGNTSATSNNKVSVSNDEAYIGVRGDSYLQLHPTSQSTLTIAKDFLGDYNGAITTDVRNGFTGTIGGTTTLTLNSTANVHAKSSVTVDQFTFLNLNRASTQTLAITSTGININGGGATLSLPNSGIAEFINSGKINIKANNSNDNIVMDSGVILNHGSDSKLSLTGEFALSGSSGTVQSTTISGYKVVQVDPKLLINSTASNYAIETYGGINIGTGNKSSKFGGSVTVNGQLETRTNKNIVAYGTGDVYARWENGDGKGISLGGHHDMKVNDSNNDPHGVRDWVNGKNFATQDWVNGRNFATKSEIPDIKGKANKPPNAVTANAGTFTFTYSVYQGGDKWSSVTQTAANGTTATVANACANAINAMR